ncbi:hypothetical protein V512_015225 [Mesotoga sp. Brook.08.105.5.1]|nr:hypothetical protein V512_015225 [Mesotoga sp. Brook.08.105.5.1]RAO96547.1 hypothetical protein M388_14205 [Mesotoga sp. Brook.08.YT.4.2.5.4.]
MNRVAERSAELYLKRRKESEDQSQVKGSRKKG